MKGATGNSKQSLEDAIHRVTSDLNEGIQNWINGSVPETDAAFDDISAATPRRFSYVFTDGGTSVDGAFWCDLRPSWGKNPEFRLATPRRYTKLLLDDERTVVAEVVELQKAAKAVDRPRHARRTTLIFIKAQEAEEGLLLWRLHESMIPPEEEQLLDWSELEAS